MFGFPCLPPRGQGRPAFAWTPEKSRDVSRLFACGYDVKRAAAVVGCCVKTFRKVFYLECRERELASLRQRMAAMRVLEAEGEKGNVAAIKALAGMIEREQARSISDRQFAKAQAANAAERREKAPAPLGKKEERKQAAERVEGLFATRTPPAGAVH